MSLTIEQIKAAAMELDPVEREVLGYDLLVSVGRIDPAAIEASWLAEAHRREELYKAGNLKTYSLDELLERPEIPREQRLRKNRYDSGD